MWWVSGASPKENTITHTAPHQILTYVWPWPSETHLHHSHSLTWYWDRGCWASFLFLAQETLNWSWMKTFMLSLLIIYIYQQPAVRRWPLFFQTTAPLCTSNTVRDPFEFLKRSNLKIGCILRRRYLFSSRSCSVVIILRTGTGRKIILFPLQPHFSFIFSVILPYGDMLVMTPPPPHTHRFFRARVCLCTHETAQMVCVWLHFGFSFKKEPVLCIFIFLTSGTKCLYALGSGGCRFLPQPQENVSFSEHSVLGLREVL